jgi:hypothetical protein
MYQDNDQHLKDITDESVKALRRQDLLQRYSRPGKQKLSYPQLKTWMTKAGVSGPKRKGGRFSPKEIWILDEFFIAIRCCSLGIDQYEQEIANQGWGLNDWMLDRWEESLSDYLTSRRNPLPYHPVVQSTLRRLERQQKKHEHQAACA